MTALLDRPVLYGSTTPRLSTPPLVAGPPGECGCGCALSPSIGWLVVFWALQGMAAGAGVVVSRAIIRDMFPPADAQRVMSQVTIYFGVAPAIAPMVGGFLFVHADWDAAAVVFDRYRSVGVQFDKHQIAMSGERFVDRIVRYFEHHMVQAAAIIGVADIHSRPLANRV